VRSGQVPPVLAAVCNAIMGLLRPHPVTSWPHLAAALRAYAWVGPAAVLGLLGVTR
jgi:hypothetical protein